MKAKNIKNITFLMGKTGSGKTTAFHYLVGN